MTEILTFWAEPIAEVNAKERQLPLHFMLTEGRQFLNVNCTRERKTLITLNFSKICWWQADGNTIEI